MNHHVALKILTANSYGGEKEVFELEILRHIETANPDHPGHRHVISLLDNFRHTGTNGEHVCLVFEVMGEDLLGLSRRYRGEKIPVHLVKQIAKQLFLGLDYLHRSCKVVHTDMKPRNIMIQLDNPESAIDSYLEGRSHETNGPNKSPSPEDCRIISKAVATNTPDSMSQINIKIADFGVASWVDKHLTEFIQPTSLRAPEVILGAKWDTSADIWNAACVIYELLQGRVLFKGRPDPQGTWQAEDDHLAQMIELFGPLPPDLLAEGSSSGFYFDKDGNMLNIHHMYRSSLENVINFKGNTSLSDEEVPGLQSFLRSMLQYRPKDRLSAAEAAKDPWLQSD
ncbi:MAG: asparagine synthetase [Chaenotheca gracillima]|nr:MAG: asparagine synthetase [Chaenotheca gracillima]